MSLYYVQKVIYELNRDPAALARFKADAAGFVAAYELRDDEARALVQADIGLLYVMGVNGQLLMHFAAANGLEWNGYIEAMRQGLKLHGPVRYGVYAMAGDLP